MDIRPVLSTKGRLDKHRAHSELSEGLGRSLVLRHPQNVESHSLRKWSALACNPRQIHRQYESNHEKQNRVLTNGNNITDLDTERRRGVGSEVLVALLVTVVLGDVVQVVPADDDRSRHLCRDNLAREDTASDRDLTSEGAFFV